MAKRLNENVMDEIVTRVLFYGEKQQDVARSVHYADATVSRLVRVFKYVRDQKWDELIHMAEKRAAHPDMVKWAARRLNVTPPIEQIEALYEAAAEEEKNGNSPQPTVVAYQSQNEDLCLFKILQALNNIDEHLVQLMDVVIPKYVSDLKDNANVNTDVLNKSMQACVHYLDGIRCNTRKRGL